jgi:hypothetical protein
VHARLLAHGDREIAQIAGADAIDAFDDDAISGGRRKLIGPTAGELSAQGLDLVVQ